MARLGLPVPRSGLRAFLVAAPAGVLFSQVLPYIYSPTVGLVLSWLPLQTTDRDVFNQLLMALLTALVSFLVARVVVTRSSGAR